MRVSLKSMRALVTQMHEQIESLKEVAAPENHFWNRIATPEKFISETQDPLMDTTKDVSVNPMSKEKWVNELRSSLEKALVREKRIS